MNNYEIYETLEAELAKVAEGRQIELQNAKSIIQAQIAPLDEAWYEIERKHQTSIRASASDSWTRSLLMLHKERQAKYEADRLCLYARLSELPVVPESLTIDFEVVHRLLDVIDSEMANYEQTLAVKRKQLEFTNDYGSVEREKWLAELSRFVEKNENIANCIRDLKRICNEATVIFDWTESVICRVDETIRPAAHLPEPIKSDGIGFEHACLAALVQAGWEGNLTKSSGDQGVDIIARKGDRSIAIQCKNYKSPVGNGAVQEVHAGKAFYETDFAIVVSPSGFTGSAIQLARKLRVLLVDPSSLNTLEKML